MKKILLIFGTIFFVFILAIVALPFLFKDKIHQAIDDAISENLEASVFYNPEEFNLSLISHFPDFTVGLGDFGIVGIEAFEGDTLVSVDNFEVTVDIMSVISGSQIAIQEISLVSPKIFVTVLADGTANYDITTPSDEVQVEEETSSTDINISIKRWSIADGQLVYSDQSTNMYTSLEGLNHEGSGDFTLEVFDMITKTTVESLSFGYDNVAYISKKKLDADITLNMDLAQMRFEFKENQVMLNDFGLHMEGLVIMPEEDIDIDIKFDSKDISLKSILSLIPGVYLEHLDGVKADGLISFDGLVKGIYNEISMPQIAANLEVENGKISYAEYDIPMEEINIESHFSYPSADLTQTSFDINNFSMLVDGERLSANLKFKNLDDYTWDFGFNGNADLEKISKIVPLQGMTLRGKIEATLASAGQMSLLESEQYDKLPTSGELHMVDFYFQSEEDLPQGFAISKANLSFDPSIISLNDFESVSGTSDFSLQGSVSNYLGYALNDELLTGSLTMNSRVLDINELMPESEATEEVEDTTALEVVKIPENLDFKLETSIDKILYTDLEMERFHGLVLIKDGAIVLERNSFNMIDGEFELSGAYSTKDVDEPKYDLGFKIKDLPISKAFESFSTIQKYVPIAKQVTGDFSTEFNVNGLLGNDMMPLMDKINLEGLVNVAKASLSKGAFVSKLNSLAAFKTGSGADASNDAVSIKDVLVKAEIKDGHLFVEPFDLEVKGQEATIGGSNTLDGKLDYSLLIKEIPTGAIGSALNGAIGSFTGGKNIVSDKIDIDFGIGGTYDDVEIKLLSTSASGSTSDAATAFKEQIVSKVDDERAKAEAKLAEEKAKAEAKAKEAAEKAKAELEAKKKAAQDEAKAAAEEAKKKAADKAKDKIKGLFKKGG